MTTPKELLKQLTEDRLTHADRAVAVLWLMEKGGSEEPMTARELASYLEGAGYAKQNVTRLARQLDSDSRTVKRDSGYRINISAQSDLDEFFEPFVGPVLPPPSNSVLPLELFFDTRGYLERVVHQANAAYDNALYDCCTVMLRRVIETLIIEIYEHEGRQDEIQDADGNYKFLSKLVSYIKNDSSLTLSRNARKALTTAKKLGDLSAHNRRYNAVQDDIDRGRSDIRTAAQELLVLAGLR